MVCVSDGHYNWGTHRDRTPLGDSRIQSASVNEEADDFPMCIPAPGRARFAELEAFKFALAHGEALTHKGVQTDTSCYQIASRLMYIHGKTGLCHKGFDGLGFYQGDLLPRILSDVVAGIAVALEPALGDSLYRWPRLHWSALLWSDKDVFDFGHISTTRPMPSITAV
jgi:hypothetical protein